MWLVLLGACAIDGLREPEPYLPRSEVAPLSPTLDDSEVTEAVLDVLADLPSNVPAGLPHAIDTFLSYAEGDCPPIRASTEGAQELGSWHGDCETPSGAVFRGGMEWRRAEDRVGDEGQLIDEFVVSTGELYMESPDGHWLEGNGYFSLSHTEGEGYSTAGAYCSGELRADPATAGSDKWLTGQTHGTISMWAGNWGGRKTLSANGSWPAEGQIVGVSVQDLRIDPRRCETEPIGAIAVREADGVWHDVAFARFVDEDTDELSGCDGCGTHMAAGVPMGDTVCMSAGELSSLLDDYGDGVPW